MGATFEQSESFDRYPATPSAKPRGGLVFPPAHDLLSELPPFPLASRNSVHRTILKAKGFHLHVMACSDTGVYAWREVLLLEL